eukprot:7047258-Ditylum_brightwellii.AAC.2
MQSSDIRNYILVKVSQPRHKKKRRQQIMQVKKQKQCHHKKTGNNNQNLINIWGSIRRMKQRSKKEKQDAMQGTLQLKEYNRPPEEPTR